jgi:hypothetical protein
MKCPHCGAVNDHGGMDCRKLAAGLVERNAALAEFRADVAVRAQRLPKRAGAKILAGLKEAVAHAKGEDIPVRITEVRGYLAPHGACVYCDARRAKDKERVRKWRAKGD